MGLVSFSCDFSALKEERSSVGDAFGALRNQPFSLVSIATFLLSPIIPMLMSVSMARAKLRDGVKESCTALARRIITDASTAEAQGNKVDEISILGLLSTYDACRLLLRRPN
jgi:hypothetical protein